MAPPHKPSEAEFDALEDTLRGILHNLTVLGHATLDFSNQNVVNENIQEVVSLLGDLDRQRGNLDMQIPRDVLMAVESGQNPDTYTMHLVSAIVSLNQAAKAKTKYADDLRHNMETELEKVWPDVMQKYKELMLDGPKKEEDGVAVEVKREDRMDTDAG